MEIDFYKNKKILVAGGTGLIGKPLVDMLINKGANVSVASLDDASNANPKTEFKKVDLTIYENCLDVCNGADYVFNLLCIKGSPKTMKEKPASVFVPMILFNTNLMKAAKQCNVKRYLYTSTLGVYSPAEIFYEDDVWKTFPSENDRFAGWAKRMGELQAEAYRIEYNWDKISIVRPANTYGPYDDFDSEASMVVPSLIKRAINRENPFVVWGDGSPVRDFIYTNDVAKGILMALENCQGPGKPINFGSGKGYSIKNLVEIILNNLDYKPKVIWDSSKPSGDRKRVMDISRAKALIGWEPQTSLEEGVKQTMSWYKNNKNFFGRYNIFEKNESN